jgi:hypothetical protein
MLNIFAMLSFLPIPSAPLAPRSLFCGLSSPPAPRQSLQGSRSVDCRLKKLYWRLARRVNAQRDGGRESFFSPLTPSTASSRRHADRFDPVSASKTFRKSEAYRAFPRRASSRALLRK